MTPELFLQSGLMWLGLFLAGLMAYHGLVGMRRK